MNIRRQTLVAALGLALASSPLMARTQLDEQDSVFSWGRWKVLAPAAGGNVLPSPLFVVKDLNAGDADSLTPRIIDETDPLVGPCDFGIGCGFTSFDADMNHPGSAEDTGSFDIDFRREQAGEDGFYATVVTLFSVGEVDYEATNDDGSIRVARSGVGVYFPDGESFMAFDGSMNGTVLPDVDNPDYSAGFWNQDGHTGLFVWGMPTGEATLSSLAAGNVVATYTGYIGAVENDPAITSEVSLIIDFGAATWSGEFATPEVKFTANGGLDGPSFVSTSLGGDAASGFVEGAVVDNAERAIGRFEIVDGAGIDHRDIFNTIRTDGLD